VTLHRELHFGRGWVTCDGRRNLIQEGQVRKPINSLAHPFWYQQKEKECNVAGFDQCNRGRSMLELRKPKGARGHSFGRGLASLHWKKRENIA